ncbi:MAG: hypothetical protein N2C14_13130, partial [Planctomycetales bacterium]
NLGLLPKEHRKLASRLTNEVQALRGASSSQTVFLESRSRNGLAGDLPMGKSPASRSGFWDLYYLLVNLALVLVIWVFSRWPIFGRPRVEAVEHLSDFGRHVEALGELLQATGDQAYAAHKVRQYHETIKPEAAARPSSDPAPKTS